MKVLPVLIDTNLLVLFVVGTASRRYIEKHKKLTQFTVEDYDTLLQMIAKASSVLVTPNTLTETSNLVGYIAEPAKGEVYQVLRQVITTSAELYITSAAAANRQELIRLGLTDAALVEASSEDVAVLTADLDLYVAALAKGAPAVNFNHVRDQYL